VNIQETTERNALGEQITEYRIDDNRSSSMFGDVRYEKRRGVTGPSFAYTNANDLRTFICCLQRAAEQMEKYLTIPSASKSQTLPDGSHHDITSAQLETAYYAAEQDSKLFNKIHDDGLRHRTDLRSKHFEVYYRIVDDVFIVIDIENMFAVEINPKTLATPTV
jgi:hypothetical protein